MGMEQELDSPIEEGEMKHLKQFEDAKEEAEFVDLIGVMRSYSWYKSQAEKLVKRFKKESEGSLIELFKKKSTETRDATLADPDMNLFLKTISAMRFTITEKDMMESLQCLGADCEEAPHSEDDVDQM